MTTPFFILVTELILLYFLSERIGKTLYSFFYLLFRNTEVATGFLTFIYLPGTVVHELSHLLVAEILRVPTGAISFNPHIEKEGTVKSEIQAGSLKIAKTDPLRRFLIGFAPVIGGIAMLMLLMWLFQYFWIQMTTWQTQTILIVFIGYLLYTVSNSMFSSKKDMEGAPVFIIVLTLIFGALYFTGIRFTLTGKALEVTINILTGLTKALGIVAGINICFLILTSLLLHLATKIFKITIKI